jgi:hypothetical protein
VQAASSYVELVLTHHKAHHSWYSDAHLILNAICTARKQILKVRTVVTVPTYTSKIVYNCSSSIVILPEQCFFGVGDDNMEQHLRHQHPDWAQEQMIAWPAAALSAAVDAA